MDGILVVLIPLAMLKDCCCGGDNVARKSRGFTRRALNMLACCMCLGIFSLNTFIFNTYIKKGNLNELKKELVENAKNTSQTLVETSQTLLGTFNFLEIF